MVAIRVLDIVVLSFGRGEFTVAASNSWGGGCLTGVIDRFTGVSSANAGAGFNPPFETGFLLDSWSNAKACFTGVTADAESGFLGVATCRVALLVVGVFSESRTRDADSLLHLDGDGAMDTSGDKNRGGTETRACTRGFLGVIALGRKISGTNALSKTTGRGLGRLGVVEINPSGSNSRGLLDGG